MKRIVIPLVVFVLLLLWVCRYSIVPASHGAYKLDRFTGQVAWLIAGSEQTVKPVVIKADWGFQPLKPGLKIEPVEPEE